MLFKRLLALVLLLVMMLSVNAVPAMAANPDVTGNIMIYTSIYPEIIEIIKPILSEEFPNLTVEWFQGGTGTVMSKMTAEIESDTIGCDILMVADPSYNIILKDMDLLHPYKSVHHDAIIGKDEEGYWYSVRRSNMIIAYNSAKYTVDEIPHTWLELAEDERFKGRIAMPDPSKSGTAAVSAGALSQRYGWEYFDKLAANGMVVEAGNNGINDKLLTGEYIAAMILEENILKLREQNNEPLTVYYPDDGTIGVPSAICTLNTSENLAAAEALTDFFLSPKGQETFIKGWMHAVRNDFTIAPFDAKPTSEIEENVFPVDWDYLAASLEEIKAKFRTALIDNAQ